MDKKQMDQFLIKAVKKFEPGVNEKLLDKVCKQSEYAEVKIEGIKYKIVRDNLIFLGKILDENEKRKTYTVCINAGVANSNPCIVVVYVDTDLVFIDAFAREGLINQHTARKAVKKIKDRFEKIKIDE